jgi:hypothetical protein
MSSRINNPLGRKFVDFGLSTLGQTAFTLPETISTPSTFQLYVEGVLYTSVAHFTIAGTTLTWLDVGFTMPLNARVEGYYFQ